MEKSYLEATFQKIEDNIKIIRFNVEKAAKESGRNAKDVKIMAVTKTVEPVYINKAIELGIDLIGESKVQEFIGKKDELRLDNIEKHFIGHLQTNKVKNIVGSVDLIQSVDRVKLAREISKHSIRNNISTKVLLEVNIGKEESKFGFMPEEVHESLAQISEFQGIEVCGLMTVPPISSNIDETRSFFSNMRQLFIDIEAKKLDNVNMNVLSMGMSGDYVHAVSEGSTLIRVGSAIFGNRNYR